MALGLVKSMHDEDMPTVVVVTLWRNNLAQWVRRLAIAVFARRWSYIMSVSGVALLPRALCATRTSIEAAFRRPHVQRKRSCRDDRALSRQRGGTSGLQALKSSGGEDARR